MIQFRRNFGKSAALAAGFAAARGEFVVTLDADLQDVPAEIPKLLGPFQRDEADLVSGWKTPRDDPSSKTLPSALFNRVVRLVTGVRLHDINCGFKAYRREALTEVPLYGELHRYIPVLAHLRGYRVMELPVRHRARQHGRSKFGGMRFFRGFFDLLTVLFLTQYTRRPLHLFGWIGAITFGLGMAINALPDVRQAGPRRADRSPAVADARRAAGHRRHAVRAVRSARRDDRPRGTRQRRPGASPARLLDPARVAARPAHG